VRHLGQASAARITTAALDAAAVLLYVVNRFDDVFDVHGPSGLADDVRLVLEAAAH
jgi:hypothetical protein